MVFLPVSLIEIHKVYSLIHDKDILMKHFSKRTLISILPSASQMYLT